MGVSQYWLSIFISKNEHDLLLPEFQRAKTEIRLSENELAGHELWKSGKPVKWQMHEGPLWNDFSCSFNLQSFEALSGELCSTNSRFNLQIEEGNAHRFIIVRRITPVSALWYALGIELAQQIPGIMGNLLVAPNDVAMNAEKVNSVFRKIRFEDLTSRVAGYLDTEATPTKVHEIATMLTDGLMQAVKRKSGILFLSRTQL